MTYPTAALRALRQSREQELGPTRLLELTLIPIGGESTNLELTCYRARWCIFNNYLLGFSAQRRSEILSLPQCDERIDPRCT